VIEQQLRRNDVALIQGEASFLDPNTLAVRSETGSSRVTARHVVIAVGTRPAPTRASSPTARSCSTRTRS
jgi:NAD(P) transhydrogenase